MDCGGHLHKEVLGLVRRSGSQEGIDFWDSLGCCDDRGLRRASASGISWDGTMIGVSGGHRLVDVLGLEFSGS